MFSGSLRAVPGPVPEDVYGHETVTQSWLPTFSPVDVVLIRWPFEGERRDRLAGEGTPRLLLLEEGVPPPDLSDCLEDWIRVPASEVDVRARIAGLASRTSAHTANAPALDRDGVLRFGAGWVSLPPVEARLTTAMLGRFGAVVSR